jgi:hypothetical protein
MGEDREVSVLICYGVPLDRGTIVLLLLLWQMNIFSTISWLVRDDN